MQNGDPPGYLTPLISVGHAVFQVCEATREDDPGYAKAYLWRPRIEWALWFPHRFPHEPAPATSTSNAVGEDQTVPDTAYDGPQER